MMVERVLMKLWGWCRGCFGISGEDGIVVALMVTAALRVVVVSSNLFKGECRVGLLTGICPTRVLLKKLI